VRADCIGKPRPCPWVSCRYHLGLEVTEQGALVPTAWRSAGGRKRVWPLRAPRNQDEQRAEIIAQAMIAAWEQGAPSCALDVADADGAVLEAVGDAMGVTRERARQIEKRALAVTQAIGGRALREHGRP
jgi:hypothetical protein